MTLRAKWVPAGAALAALVALGLMTSGGAAASPDASASKIKGCVESDNIEAIIDDSASMRDTDPGRLRASLMEAIVGLPANEGKLLGAVEFASQASTLFPPTPIGTADAQSALALPLFLIQGDGAATGGGSSTNYNAGFTAGNLANPTATSRIFLSDGVSNAGGDPSTYRTPPTKTYVVGFDAAIGSGSVLGQIAAETGGTATQVVTASEILPTAGVITAALNCEDLQAFSAELNKEGQTKSHAFKATGKTAQVLTTWPTASTKITINVAQVLAGGKAGKSVAVSAAKRGKVGKVKGSRSKGTNFAGFEAKGLRKGRKYRISVKAKELPVPTVATTQVIK
jgi:hypothetical protein